MDVMDGQQAELSLVDFKIKLATQKLRVLEAEYEEMKKGTDPQLKHIYKKWVELFRLEESIKHQTKENRTYQKNIKELRTNVLQRLTAID